MINQLSHIGTDCVSLILYTDSSSLEYIATSTIKQHFDVNKDYVLIVDTEKALLKAKSTANIAPLIGKKWLIIVDADKIDSKAIIKQALDVYDSALILYRTTQYRVFKTLGKAEFATKLGRLCPVLYGGNLNDKDISAIAAFYNVSLEEKILKTLSTKYNREADAVCRLCSMLQSGYTIESKQDIIDAVGLGGASVAGLLMHLLGVLPKTFKGRKTSMRYTMNYLNDLSHGLSYDSIQNFILDTLAGFIDIKEMQIAGKLSILNNNPPESFDSKRAARFNRLLRFQYKLEHDISLEKLLVVRSMFIRDRANPKNAIIQWIYRIYDGIGCSDEPELVREQRINGDVPANAKFSLDDYNAHGQLSLTKPKSSKKVLHSASELASIEGITPDDAKSNEDDSEVTLGLSDLLTMLGVSDNDS